MTEEQWKRIEGFDMYEVSNQGNFRRTTGPHAGRLLNVQRSSYNVLKVHMISNDGKRTMRSAARTVLKHFGPPEPSKNYGATIINRRDKNPLRVENLRWKTETEGKMNRHTHSFCP